MKKLVTPYSDFVNEEQEYKLSSLTSANWIVHDMIMINCPKTVRVYQNILVRGYSFRYDKETYTTPKLGEIIVLGDLFPKSLYRGAGKMSEAVYLIIEEKHLTSMQNLFSKKLTSDNLRHYNEFTFKLLELSSDNFRSYDIYLNSPSKFFKIKVIKKTAKKNSVSVKDNISDYKNLPGFQELINLGFEFTSTDRQLLNGTLQLSMPVYAVWKESGENIDFVNRGKYPFRITISKSGVILLDDGDTMAKSLVKVPELKSIEDYKNAFESMMPKLQNYLKRKGIKLEKKTPEERLVDITDYEMHITMNSLWENE